MTPLSAWTRTAAATFLLTAAVAFPAPAQRPPNDSTANRWRRGIIFAPQFGGQHGLGFELGASLFRPRRADPPPQTAEFRVSGRYGTTGSRDATFMFRAPGLVRDWRFLGLARSERMQRMPYFGVDNQAAVEDSLERTYGDTFYRSAMLRTTVFGAVSRRIAGPLWLQAAFQQRWYRATALADRTTLFGRDVAAGRLLDTSRNRAAEGRLGLMYDTRDFWDVARRGVLVELMAARGALHDPRTGGRTSYRRYLVGAREFVQLSERTVLALRQQATFASDTLPYFQAYEQLTTGVPDDGLVGPRSIRLHGAANQLASNQAFVGVDLRRMLLVLRENPVKPIRFWVLAFADYGTLWEPRQPPATFEYQWTLGTGFRAQLHKASVIGLDVGVTDDGFEALAVTFFAF